MLALFIGGKDMDKFQSALLVMQTMLAFFNICILSFAFFRFVKRPHDDINHRVTELEIEIKEIKTSLLQGNDRFRDQESTNEVLIHSVLALIEFEIQYCLVEHKEMSKGLEKAKEDLHNYLSKK